MLTGRGTGSAPYCATGLTNTKVLVQAGKISLAGFFYYNGGAAVTYVQFFDAAATADVTLGTTTPNYVLAAAATNWSQGQFALPLQFTKGMVIAATTTPTGSTAPSATGVITLALNS